MVKSSILEVKANFEKDLKQNKCKVLAFDWVVSPGIQAGIHLQAHLSVLGVVHRHRGVALRRRVHVPVVADGADGLHGVPGHAGHGDGRQPVARVVVEDVLTLAVQQQHHGLSGGGERDECEGVKEAFPP